MMSKEELENNKSALELLLSESLDSQQDYTSQISVIDQELEDLGRPKVTPAFLDKIFETINEAIEQLEFDSDCIEYTLELDYDNRITLDDVSIKDPRDMTTMIYKEVEKLFAEVEAPNNDILEAQKMDEKFN